MLDKRETFEPSSEVFEAGPVRQPYNKLRPLGKKIIPSVRVGENVAEPGTFTVATKPPVKSNAPINFYQVSSYSIYLSQSIFFKFASVICWNQHNLLF